MTGRRSSRCDDQLYTAKEYAGRYKVTLRTVRRWIAEGAVEVVRIGGIVRIRESARKRRR